MKPRTSPVIWNGAGPLNGRQRDAYESDGYVLLRQVLDDAMIRTLRAEVDGLRAQQHESTILERDRSTVRSVFDAHRLNPVIAECVVQHGHLLDVAEQILGKGLYVHQCHVNFKSPGGGGFAWHSDFTFWFWEDGMPEPRAISMFVFLDAARTETGPLCVIPGSHKVVTHTEWYREVRDHRRAVRHDDVANARRNGIPDAAMLRDLTRASAIETSGGEPDDVLVTDANLVHASGHNFGVHDRRILLLILNHIDNKIGTPRSGEAARPEYISSRTFDLVR